MMTTCIGLTQEQNEAVDLAVKGHNLVICGQAGTGKSYTLRNVVQALRQRGCRVAVTATTGIASQQFRQLGSMTIHSWAGMQDGRYSAAELSRLLKDDERFHDAMRRIRETECLVLDEMSMLSAKMFELIESVTRSVRNNACVFGGLQVIFAGDFYQLPPVKNAMYDEDGQFCFVSPLWSKAFPHAIELSQVLRQEERGLVQAVSEAAKGSLSEESCKLLASLQRPLHVPENEKLVKLYGTNQEVDVENTNSVIEMPGEIFTYRAEDDGSKQSLRRLIAPRILHLKRGCPVMLITNLSSCLVNGSLGCVVDFGEEGPVVHFIDADKTVELKKVQFTVFNPQLKTDIAVRRQVPLKPAFAMTVHKSQGMTLKFVSIDCHQIKRPGQLGVAVGRAQHTDGLQIVHFHPSCCVTQLDSVREFYDNIPNDQVLHEDKSCCRHQVIEDNLISLQSSTIPCEQDHDRQADEVCDVSDEELRDIDAAIEEVLEEDFQLPEGYDVPGLVDSAKYEQCHTPYQEHVNNFLIHCVREEKFHKFIGWEKDKISAIILKHTSPGERAPQKEETAIYAEFAMHMRSTEHMNKCRWLVGSRLPTDEEFNGIYRVLTTLRKREVDTMAKTMTAQTKQTAKVTRRLPCEEDMTDGARGKIRYVGGFCIAKVRYQYQEQTNRLIFRLDSPSRDRMKKANRKVILLSGLTLSETQAQMLASDRGSLGETTRRQNVTQGLTHIRDPVYNFFFTLCGEVIQLQTAENLSLYGERVNEFVLNNIKENDKLKGSFSLLFEGSEEFDTCLVNELFLDVVELYCRVMLKQLRKDYLAAVLKKKGHAHRKKILMGKGGDRKELSASGSSTSKVQFTFASIVEDDSPERSWSHSQLKTTLPVMKKNQLQALCRCYQIGYKQQDTMTILRDKLKEKISQSGSMPNPNAVGITGSVRSTGRKRKADLESVCRECQQSETEDEEWIKCDGSCGRWYHRGCAEIFDEEEWNDYKNNGVAFICSYC